MTEHTKLGFIGTGVITEAIINGMIRANWPTGEILVSRRGAETSHRLARAHGQIRICDDNQTIVDEADLIILAVRPQIAQEVLSGLRFASGQRVLSLIAMTPVARLQEWLGPQVAVTRAIPLPSVAQCQGVTAIYPPEPDIAAMFTALGTAFVTSTEAEFDAYAVASATMATSFGMLDTVSDWMLGQGVAQKAARAYLGGLFSGLAQTAAEAPDQPFAVLREGHSTPGGLNEQCHDDMARAGGFNAMTMALDRLALRVGGRDSGDESGRA